MLPAPIPVDESDRLAALRKLLLLDTPPEERFDRIVSFAAAEFDCPIALISLVDSERQWFKARVGLEACETSRDISFCGHAIAQDELFMVEDALQDERFANNPLVTAAPYIRFYAGAPLRCGAGSHIGTLCLIDTRPRRFDSIDQCVLAALRQVVEDELKRAPQQS